VAYGALGITEPIKDLVRCAVTNGIIFLVTPGGAETALCSFGTVVSDGLVPRGDLIHGPGGGLYGMTEGGGVNGLGAVVMFI
jgi:hypothetical protein